MFKFSNNFKQSLGVPLILFSVMSKNSENVGKNTYSQDGSINNICSL